MTCVLKQLRVRLSRAIGIAISVVLAPSAVRGQSTNVPPPPPPTKALVSAVEVRREDVFDRVDSSLMARMSNALHVTTKERVVMRELLIREGQPFDSAAAAETERNLRKLGIFRTAVVDSVSGSSGLIEQVTTRDAWTTAPYLMFKSTGTQVTYGVGITEKNLLGYNIRLLARYTKDPDRTTKQLELNAPRVLWDRVGFTGTVNQLSDGRNSRLTISAPFPSLSSRSSFTLDLRYDDGDVLRFFGGESVASDTLRHLMSKGTFTGSWATHAAPDGFVRLTANLQFRREDYTQARIADSSRTFFGEGEFGVDVSQAKFIVVREYKNLGPQEDVDLSPTLHAGLWFAPTGWGYDRGGVGPNLTGHVGQKLPYGFTLFDLRASGLFTGKGLDSGSVATQATMILNPAPRHSIVANVSAGLQKKGYPGEEFDLGLSFGPRAYPAHSFTGDRGFFTTAEYRWIAMPDVFGLLAVGLAGFADYGGAWYDGSPQRTGKDFGVGLRIGSMRAASAKGAGRIDLAYRSANDAISGAWVLVVGSGFAFERIIK